ncbi:hypothetical protein N9J93_00460 [Methylophilaceae bacterium]|nr:hypothetical protein [Methylophilaceae bacterium]
MISSYLISTVLFFGFLILFFYLWKVFFIHSHLFRYYNSVQRSHESEVPRFGGVCCLIFILIYCLINDLFVKPLVLNLFLSLIPLLLISLVEDFFHCIKPLYRFLGMLFSILLFFSLDNIVLPNMYLPFFDYFHDNNIFLTIFYIFSLLVLINGNNLIDGMNGILITNLIAQLLALIFLCYKFNDSIYMEYAFIFLLPLLLLFIFNYPLGKIFMGDTGAYIYGFLIGTILISFFGKHPELITWNAVFIFLYPSFELLFSIIRKFFEKEKGPTNADMLHLHSIIYKLYLKKTNGDVIKSNNNVLKIMVLFSFSPTLVIFIYDSFTNILLAIILFLILYTTLYFYLRRLYETYYSRH